LPIFINNPADYIVSTPENGELSMVLLEILVKAESTETSREMMTFKITGGNY